MSDTIFIDSSNCRSDLCVVGGKFNTDKSPFATNSGFYKHRKGFTAVYQMLFSPYINKQINIAEIGIDAGGSLKLWNYFFNKCNIYGFEYNNDFINECKKLEIPNTQYIHTDVSNVEYLDKTFADTNVTFDIIIEDSTHTTEHQNNVIDTVAKYIKPGGILIIEDIQRITDISEFHIDKNVWCFSTFLICHHDNRFCYDNDKILYLVKK